jgi:hypothetical protein
MHQTDEFMLIRHQLGVARWYGLVEECHWSSALMENHLEAMDRRIALDNEVFVECWQLQDRR